ncbi:MAG: VanW family protein [Lachnospiraceae bacterium]|nr:VanW family protein [Lachnospiraceae bacterium]
MKKFGRKRMSGRIASVILALVILAGFTWVDTCNVYAAEISDEQAVKKVFDATYYAAHNPDVVIARGDSEAALLNHFMENGLAEGRSASADFNVRAYRARYADLDAAFGDDWFRYVRHYVTKGIAEGRDASPLPANSGAGNSSDKKEYTLLGTYTTRYTDNVPRAINVGIAAAGINGVIVQPGAQFSYTNTIPARTVENGYQEATIFVNKEKVQGLGGGICQVSSTLYACMKTVGLAATERHPHSLPVDYVPEGWDATISGQSVDLKFINTYSTPLMIVSRADHGKLSVSLYLQK